MPLHLEARLRGYTRMSGRTTDLLFLNRRSRPFSANKLREKVLHPLLDKLGIRAVSFDETRCC